MPFLLFGELERSKRIPLAARYSGAQEFNALNQKRRVLRVPKAVKTEVPVYSKVMFALESVGLVIKLHHRMCERRRISRTPKRVSDHPSILERDPRSLSTGLMGSGGGWSLFGKT